MDHVIPYHAPEKVVQTLYQKLYEILNAFRHELHIAGCQLNDEDDPKRHNPGHHHGVGDW